MSSLSSDPAFGELRSIGQSRTWGNSLVREILAIVAIVALADVTIYRGHGYTGLAVFFLGAIGLFFLGKRIRNMSLATWVVAGMLVVLTARLVWYGSPLQVFLGLCLVVVYATTLDGQKPFLINAMLMASQTLVAGLQALRAHFASATRSCPSVSRSRTFNVLLPVVVFLLFSGLFVLANPDVVSFVGRHIERMVNVMSEWLIRSALRPTEPLFWIAIAWITAGLLRPMFQLVANQDVGSVQASPPTESSLYTAYRNTLCTVIALFAFYLVYEFFTLWTRDFPEGFYYAGYAHEGAAWLTVALALATLILCIVFSGPILQDPRLSKLKGLAWIWSAQNLLLSLAVYNRLFIYIDFNGLTRMRIIGLFGTSLVVAGFLLVVWKIVFTKDFAWLIHRQCWAFAIAVYLFALTPVDRIAVSHNVQRVLAGDLSASMQIGVHKLNLEGTMALPPLLQCQTPEIREGVAALIAKQYLQLQNGNWSRQQAGWTAFQASDSAGLNEFEAVKDQWEPYLDDEKREEAINRFHDFAYQWY